MRGQVARRPFPERPEASLEREGSCLHSRGFHRTRRERSASRSGSTGPLRRSTSNSSGAGMDVELEHGLRDLLTNVTDDDPLRHRQDRARPPARVPRLLHAARADGGAGEDATTAPHECNARPPEDDALNTRQKADARIRTADPFITRDDRVPSPDIRSREKAHGSDESPTPRWRPKPADGKRVDPA